MGANVRALKILIAQEFVGPLAGITHLRAERLGNLHGSVKKGIPEIHGVVKIDVTQIDEPEGAAIVCARAQVCGV